MDITTTLIAEIVSQCQRKGFVVSPHLAASYAKAMFIGYKADEFGVVEVTPAAVEAVVDKAVDALARSDSPALESHKMLASLLVQQQESTNTNRTDLIQHRAKSQQLLQEVCHKVDHSKVFGDIALYILHETGLFSSRNENVQKETVAALESVIPRAAIESFISTTENEKLKQLEELWKIVWGIRLFNRSTGKGGSGIQDLPGELETIIKSTQGVLSQQSMAIKQQCANYLTVLTNLQHLLDPSQWARLNEEYCNRKQFLYFSSMIMESAENVSSKVTSILPEFNAEVVNIKSMVSGSTSVPKVMIYPKFIKLSDYWGEFKKQYQEIKDAKKLLDLLMAFQNSFSQTLKQSWVDEALKIQNAKEVVLPNPLMLEHEINYRGKNSACHYVPSVPSNILKHNGFCIVSLLERGILKEHEPRIGFVKLQDTFYGFADDTSMKEFVANPNKYTQGLLQSNLVVDLAIVQLLNLLDHYPGEIYLQGTRDKHAIAKHITKCDADTQTGQIDPYKDYKYEWNEWELRRLALQLANLRNKKTHSCQTYFSHFKSVATTQTFPKRDTSIQTAVDAATQPKKLVRYIKGLRGHEETVITEVKMEFDD